MVIIKRLPVVIGVAFVGTYLAYQYLMNEEQRSDVRTAVAEVRNAVQDVTDVVSPLVKKGPTRAEEEAAVRENQARTREQWHQIGY